MGCIVAVVVVFSMTDVSNTTHLHMCGAISILFTGATVLMTAGHVLSTFPLYLFARYIHRSRSIWAARKPPTMAKGQHQHQVCPFRMLWVSGVFVCTSVLVVSIGVVLHEGDGGSNWERGRQVCVLGIWSSPGFIVVYVHHPFMLYRKIGTS